LAAGLAHEIGNPLAVIQGYLGLLARSGQSDENQDFLRRADQELQRVSGLVRQLLDCARVSKGRPGIFSVHNLLYSAIEMVRVQAAFKHIKLTVNATAERDSVYVDPDQLRQVLLNCLLNSADATSSAGEITLTTNLLPDRRLLRLCIEDNGIGIAEDQLGAVFDPFYTTKEPGKGTGLGLSVSRSIIENAGGWMKMESKTGQGSIMSICLPLAAGGGNNG
jgi:signal transduction histidine kinase